MLLTDFGALCRLSRWIERTEGLLEATARAECQAAAHLVAPGANVPAVGAQLLKLRDQRRALGTLLERHHEEAAGLLARLGHRTPRTERSGWLAAPSPSRN